MTEIIRDSLLGIVKILFSTWHSEISRSSPDLHKRPSLLEIHLHMAKTTDYINGRWWGLQGSTFGSWAHRLINHPLVVEGHTFIAQHRGLIPTHYQYCYPGAHTHFTYFHPTQSLVLCQTWPTSKSYVLVSSLHFHYTLLKNIPGGEPILSLFGPTIGLWSDLVLHWHVWLEYIWDSIVHLKSQ